MFWRSAFGHARQINSLRERDAFHTFSAPSGLKDDNGRATGFVGGKIVNNIPGVVVQRTIAAQNWRGAPEPTYLVPKDAEITATIDGSSLTKNDKETITLIGTGIYSEVSEIVVEPSWDTGVQR